MTAVITNPGGAAYGASGLAGWTGDDAGVVVVELQAGDVTMVRGSLIALSAVSPGRAIKSATGTAPKLILGFARATPVAIDAPLAVVIGGIFRGALKDATAIAAGDPLGRSATVAGTILTSASTLPGEFIAIALAAAGGGASTVDVFVGKF